MPSTSHDDLNVFFGGFQNLMPHRIQHVLLVSSLYESFILEEEGLLTELITSAYLELNLSHAPRVTRVSTVREALEVIDRQAVDLVIAMTRLGGPVLADFAEQVKRRRADLPVVVLADEPRDLRHLGEGRRGGNVDRVFVWNGDARILLAIVKLIEDRLNAEHDARVGDVRIIILVENSVRFYSAYLPLIYSEMMRLTQSLMDEGINRMHKLLRMRARPRILLAETFEEAWDLYSRFGEHLLGIISDVRFPRDGALDARAGLEFVRRVRADAPYLPVLLQSSEGGHAAAAESLRARFINKTSRSLLEELRGFMLGSLGFGEFVFTLPDGTEVERAGDLRALEEALARVPREAIAFHARNNHFSNWLMARTEFELAARIRPRRVADFGSLEDLRTYLLDTLAEFRRRRESGVIADFAPDKFRVIPHFTRIGGGSIGGKARGLAFINALIRRHSLASQFPNVQVRVPTSAAIGTEVFDTFLRENGLREFVAQAAGDKEIVEAFLRAPLPAAADGDLAAFLGLVGYPLAVRSSSMLEDSPDRPFAGIYATHMIPNNHPDEAVRLEQLRTAVKLVYASTCFRAARHYLESTGRHEEEEKMGVIVQELVGSPHGGRFYPTFSGVARSYNYYPAPQMAPEEGVACVALGLGKMVVEGGQCLMFSPAHPLILPQFATPEDTLANSQRNFYALDTRHGETFPEATGDGSLLYLDLSDAEADGTLTALGSVYSAENDAIYDGTYRPGVRLVTFAHVLKSEVFPLARILRELLAIGRDGMACPVEIEFAVDLSSAPATFAFLQIRPIVSHEEASDVVIAEADEVDAVCFSPLALGNGRMVDIQDVVYVKPRAFDAAYTREIAAEIGRVNAALIKAGRSCVLIGPGRWGSADRWLGIPVRWEQISAARVIVETTLPSFPVTPSQGTHFFQNLTLLGVGYLTVDAVAGTGAVDWDWLERQEAVEESRFLRRLCFEEALEVRLDGRVRRGVILKPGSFRSREPRGIYADE